MDIDTLRAKALRAATDPAAAAGWLKRKVLPPSNKMPQRLKNSISATLEQRVKEIAATDSQSIAVYSDKASFDAIATTLTDRSLTWFSEDFDELGARRLSDQDPSGFDALVVAGPNTNASYRHAIRWLSKSNHAIPVYWVSQSFEFCAGTLPVPSMCEDAEIDIFNHFEDFLGNKESLLVRVEAFDQARSVARWVIMPPRGSLRVKLSEWLPQRQGPACVFHHCSHPFLTRGRHYRWRATGQLHWRGSASMVHGDGDFRGPTAHTEHKISAAAIPSGKVVFSLPNYSSDMSPEATELDILNRRSISSSERRPDQRIDEITLQVDNTAPEFDEFFGVRFAGYGGSFWYTLSDGQNDDLLPSIAANHSVRSWFQPPPLPAGLPPTANSFVKTLQERGLVLDPHALPVEPRESPVEYGFEFDTNVPLLRKFDVHAFDAEGRCIGQGRFEKTEPGFTFADEVLSLAGLAGKSVNLLLISPDWIDAGMDPRGRGASGNIVARLRSTGDFDVTEFQNCWRNLGVVVNELPHWLSQDRMLVGRTNIMCGLSSSSDLQVGVALVNASGNKNYSSPAALTLKLVNATGAEKTSDSELSPFGCATFWLDDHFEDWRDHLSGDQGTLIVQSPDADLNGNLVSVRAQRSISLQHLWGY